MLFVALIRVKPQAEGRRFTRRATWKYPAGIKRVAEYWLPNNDIRSIVIFESDSAVPVMQSFYDWSDLYDITIVPAITEEQGLGIAQHFQGE